MSRRRGKSQTPNDQTPKNFSDKMDLGFGIFLGFGFLAFEVYERSTSES
jgi:hypothetical protein